MTLKDGWWMISAYEKEISEMKRRRDTLRDTLDNKNCVFTWLSGTHWCTYRQELSLFSFICRWRTQETRAHLLDSGHIFFTYKVIFSLPYSCKFDQTARHWLVPTLTIGASVVMLLKLSIPAIMTVQSSCKQQSYRHLSVNTEMHYQLFSVFILLWQTALICHTKLPPKNALITD